MNKDRFAKAVAVAVGFSLLIAARGTASADSTRSATMRAPNAISQSSQARRNTTPQDDFAGLNYTDEQKAQIERIHQDLLLRKGVIVKDEKLSPEQKDAMLVGYARMEYGQIFKVLTPEQQKQVRQKILARRAADQVAKNKQSQRNPN
jgi:Spy/CpxP family protein refolding chaperone